MRTVCENAISVSMSRMKLAATMPTGLTAISLPLPPHIGSPLCANEARSAADARASELRGRVCPPVQRPARTCRSRISAW